MSSSYPLPTVEATVAPHWSSVIGSKTASRPVLSVKIFANSANVSFGPTTGYVLDSVFSGPREKISSLLAYMHIVLCSVGLTCGIYPNVIAWVNPIGEFVSFYGSTESHNSIFWVVVRLGDVGFPYVARGSYLPFDNIAAIAYWYKTVLNGHW